MNAQIIKSLVNELNHKYSNKEIYTALNISKTTFYRWIKTSKINISLDEKEIIDICKKNYYRYGYRKVQSVLKTKGLIVNHKKVLRIMRKHNILSKARRKKKNFNSGAISIIAPNLMNRKFRADAPYKKWFTDITYLQFGKKTLYLSAIMDGFNGQIISYKLSEIQDINLVKDTLKEAIRLYKPKDLILHSDQGSVYTSPSFQKFVEESNITMSMSRKGNCHDNAAMESFFSSLKIEAFYSQNIQNITNQLVEEVVLEYMYYYNYDRIQAKLNYLSPVDYKRKVV
jgi:putative transposase